MVAAANRFIGSTVMPVQRRIAIELRTWGGDVQRLPKSARVGEQSKRTSFAFRGGDFPICK